MHLGLTKLHTVAVQTFYFHLVFTAGSLAVWTYYTALILKASNYDLVTVFLHQGVMYFGLLIGFLVAGKFFRQLNYTNTYRVGMLILALACIVSLLSLNQILNIHLLVAFLRGLGEAFFWITHHIANTRDIVGAERKIFQGRVLATTDLLSILIAPLAGALITLSGYEWIFAITAAFYVSACFMSWSEVKFSKESLHKKDLSDIVKNPNFSQWASISYFEEFMLAFRSISTMILPFLLITNEFEVGVFMAFIAFVGSVISIWDSHRSDRTRSRLGFLGAWIILISNFILVGSWNLAGLGVRSVLSRFGFSFYNPKKSELKYQQRELLIKDFKGEHALEVQIIAEVILFAGRLSAILVILAGIYLFKMDPLNLLYLMFVASMFREGITLWADERLVKQMKI